MCEDVSFSWLQENSPWNPLDVFMVSPELFVLSSLVYLLFRTVWFLTIGIMFFNCSGKEFPP